MNYIHGHQRRGQKHRLDSLLKIGKASHNRQIGINNSFYGRHHSEQTLQKLRGENRPSWKGDDVSIETLHQYLHRRIPKPDLCPKCNKRPAYDLANISIKYNPKTYNRNLSNWFWVCRRCHMESDGRLRR